MVEHLGADGLAFPGGIGQRRNARRRFSARRTLRDLVARRHGANDVGFHDDVAGAADHQQMFDVVAADQHKAAAAIDGGGIDHGQPRHPSAGGVGAEAVVGESPNQPGSAADQGQDGYERKEECNR